MSSMFDDLRQQFNSLISTLAGIVIDSELKYPIKRTEEISKIEGLGQDALIALQVALGDLHIDRSQASITPLYVAWFGDYDEGTKTGQGPTEQEAFTDLLQRYT